MDFPHSYGFPGAWSLTDLLASLTVWLLSGVNVGLQPCLLTLCEALPLAEHSWLQGTKETEECRFQASRPCDRGDYRRTGVA